MKYGLPPSVQGLQKFDVNRRGEVEAVRQSLYDFQTYASAGQTQLIFFQVPQGQGGKTKDDTNMELAGSLPRPKEFLIESIEIYFFPGVDIGQFGTQAESEWSNDVQAVGSSGFLDLFIGSKSYLTALWRISLRGRRCERGHRSANPLRLLVMGRPSLQDVAANPSDSHPEL